jgi:hypothetical protein
MRFREKKRDEETSPGVNDAGFRHSSRHHDLESLLADHTIDPEAAAAVQDWLPSRRGNSGRDVT